MVVFAATPGPRGFDSFARLVEVVAVARRDAGSLVSLLDSFGPRG